MKYSEFISELSKIFEKKIISEKTQLSKLNFDSLKILEILALADKKFVNLKIDVNKLYDSKNIKDIIRMFNIKR